MARRDREKAAIPDFLEGFDKDDPASLSKVEAKVVESLRLYYLQMNRAQEPFVRIKNKRGRAPKTRLFESGNQVGKCFRFNTLVDCIDGPVPIGWLYKRGIPFGVWSWDGSKRVKVRAGAPFKKPGLHQCYRIELADGRWIEAADHHLILCEGGWKYVEDLYSDFLSKQGPFSSHVARPAKANQVAERVRRDMILCSESLERNNVVNVNEFVGGNYETGLTSSAISLPRFLLSLLPRCSPILSSPTSPQTVFIPGRLMASEPFISARVGAEAGNRLPVWEYGKSVEAKFTGFLNESHFWPGSLLSLVRHPNNLFSAIVRACSSRMVGVMMKLVATGNAEHEKGTLPGSSHTQIIRHNHVESHGIDNVIDITPIPGLHEVYDFEVPIYHNYFAAGLIHHNTTIGVAEDIAHAMGFRPWLDEGDPDYRIPIILPNNGIMGCEVAGQTLTQRIEPEFMGLIPKYCMPDVTRYSDGSIKSLYLTFNFKGEPCGSTIHFRSYVQPADTWEGVISHWVHFDEPPPRDILTAATRGLMSTNGPSWYTMTPLKEAYIYDLLSLHAFNNGGEDPEIAVFRGSTWDNCQDWCRDCDFTIEENKPENLKPGEIRPVRFCPKCRKAMGFLPREGIQNYLKKITDPDEREAREEGKWKHLSGLVYKELDRVEHIYPDFEIPRDWMRIEVVDPHDARPTRWFFGAVSPEEIEVNGKQANRIYWYTYLLAQGNIHAIARSVRMKRAEYGYKEPTMVILDAKYGSQTRQTADYETSWEEELEKAGIRHIKLSHSAPGDISLGHKMVKEYLRPHFSTVKDKSFPGMMFAAEGCKGDRGPIQDMFNYQWKPGTDKPEEAYKDGCDCVRYAALEQPTYHAPEPEIDEHLARMLLNKENRVETSNPLYHGLVLR